MYIALITNRAELFFMLAISSSAAAAKSLQSCPTLCDPIDGSPPGSPYPWDSPGKNTGVGCHFLLQCMKVKSQSEVAQSCPTLGNPTDCSLPGSFIHGIFQARVLEWGAIVFSRLVSGNLGRWVWALTLRVYKVFTKTGQGPWLRGDSSLGPTV